MDKQVKLNKQQTLILIERFNAVFTEELLNKNQMANEAVEYSTYGGGVVYRVVYRSKGTGMVLGRDRRYLTFLLESPYGTVEGKYKLPWFLFKIFNKPWRQWINIRMRVEAYNHGVEKREKENELKAQREQFNHVVYSAYPDELNKIILGDEDDD